MFGFRFVLFFIDQYVYIKRLALRGGQEASCRGEGSSGAGSTVTRREVGRGTWQKTIAFELFFGH